VTGTVSLLVPVFNRADLLVPCVESALAQTMPDLEVIVVDGASTDGTWDVCRRIAAADPRVRIFREAVNSGPVRGWWRCVEEARGTYATFLWSDDVLQPTFLERTVPYLAREDVGFVFTAAEVGAEPGCGKVRYAQPSRVMPSREFIEGSLAGIGTYPVSPACALFRLTDVRQSFVPELPTEPRTDLSSTGAGVDQLLYLLTAVRYPYVASISEPLAFFRSHVGSITVDGRAGRVALDYALAGMWFATTYGYSDHAAAILARQWLRDMRATRCFISPASETGQYRDLVGAKDLAAAAITLLARRAVISGSARIRRRDVAPVRDTKDP